MLLFKKKFLADIRSGAKTQTIRLWPFCRMKAGQRSYIPGAGYIRVLAVDPIDVSDLSDADAIPDGFPNAASLQAELRSLYGPQLAAGQRAYRIRFARLTPAEQAEAIAARAAKRAQTRSPGSPGADDASSADRASIADRK